MQDYPNFQELNIEDSRAFHKAFLAIGPKISEFTFTNLYAWRHAYKLKCCLLDDFIILRSESESKMRFFDPIGTSNKKQAIERILKDSPGDFMRIPEETTAIFSQDARFKIILDIDNSDYLYKTEDLIQLKGKKYDGKRNLIRNFKSHNSYEYARITHADTRELLKFQESWCKIKDCESIEGLSHERQAVKEILLNFVDFELIGGLIRINSEISAVSIAQKLSSDTLVMHVLKANPSITGLYQLMLNEFLSQEAENFTYVNLEQDLGQPGLRKSKQSYHPLGLIKKYTLSLID